MIQWQLQSGSTLLFLQYLYTSATCPLLPFPSLSLQRYKIDTNKVIAALFGHRGKGEFSTGIFGRLVAYFGTVENQCRGSLHLHMLLWLQGVTPASVREYIQDPEQERHFIAFLESIIRERLPDKMGEREEAPACYRCPDPDESTFEEKFESYLGDVVMKSNIHKHTKTCYKYLKKGQPLVCRLDYGRKIQASTYCDDYTGGIFS